MKQRTKYEAEDGTLFDSADLATARDVLIQHCKALNAMLPPAPTTSHDRVHHVPETLRAFRAAVVELCRELYPKESVFQHDPEVIHPFSHAGRILSDAAPRCVNNLWWRLMCCADNDEYEQPYFASNPHEFKEKQA